MASDNNKVAIIIITTIFSFLITVLSGFGAYVVNGQNKAIEDNTKELQGLIKAVNFVKTQSELNAADVGDNEEDIEELKELIKETP